MTIIMILMRLGEILFNGTEVPQSINGGGMQKMSVHENIGGKRTVDTLGKSDSDISFNGLFRGIISLERVKYLDTLRINGGKVSFAYSFFNYKVVVKSFTWQMKMAYEVYYQISLTIVEDLNSPVSFPIIDSFSDIIQGAYTQALDLALLLQVGGIIGALGALGIALEAAGDLNALTGSGISSISQALDNSINAVDGAIGGFGA